VHVQDSEDDENYDDGTNSADSIEPPCHGGSTRTSRSKPWFTQTCLNNVLRLDTYIEDAERGRDQELAEFFRKAQSESRKGAEQGKQLLAARLAGAR